jgi:hypothetical protein
MLHQLKKIWKLPRLEAQRNLIPLRKSLRLLKRENQFQ